MKQEFYRQVGFTILRNNDDTAFIDVPLFIKVTEVNDDGLTPEEEKLIKIISEVIIKGNEQRIADKFTRLKKGVKENGIHN